MPGALRKSRIDAVRKRNFGRYLAYAVGEVVLIFIGITLAVAFDRAAEQRAEEELVRGLLVAVSQGLAANVAELEGNIVIDSSIAASLVMVVDHLSTGDVWEDSLGSDLERSLHWSSPFLATSGYESLKQNGLHQIPDDQLRADLIHLFKSTYALLVDDLDRGMWVFQGSALIPTVLSELVRVDVGNSLLVSGGSFAPRNFDTAVSNDRLRTMLLEHQSHLIVGTRLRQLARDETLEVLESIEKVLKESGGVSAGTVPAPPRSTRDVLEEVAADD